ncbi:MAG TPA: PHB depolymerase family esterase, partial [Polyangiaceae bacterium]
MKTNLASSFLFAIVLAACGSGSAPSGVGGAGGGADSATPGNGGASSGPDASSGGGGISTGVGGAIDSGGTNSAGAGGAIGSGGRGMGGASAGGGGGIGGASAGSAGGASDGGIADGGATAGCNAPTWPAGGTANPQTITVMVNGTPMSRTFYFAAPTGYVSSKAYRAIFAWHYAGGMAATIAGTGGGGRYYGIQPLLADSFFIAPQGLADAQGDAAPTTGWPNTNGRDVAFARAMVDWLKSNFCIDTTRVMSTGFSYGAIMSHTVACQMPDVFRAIGVMSGSLIGRATS